MKSSITSNRRALLRASYPILLAFATSFVAAEAQAKVTFITSVPYTITTPGTYQVQQDLILTGVVASVDNSAIGIESSNVRLNLNGFELSNQSNAVVGIAFLSGLTNVTVQNGAITGFETGVGVESGQQCQLLNLNINLTSNTGIFLASGKGNQGTNGNTIRNCTVTGCPIAIELQYENSDLIKNCFIVNPSVGVNSVFGNNVIRNCTFSNTNTANTPLGMLLSPTDVYQNIVFAGPWQNPPIQGGMPAK